MTSPRPTGPPDTGAATPRTGLAWQRTALSVVAGSLLLARLALDDLGVLVLPALVVALPLAAWVLLRSRPDAARRLGTATAAALLAAAVVVLCLVEGLVLLR